MSLQTESNSYKPPKAPVGITPPPVQSYTTTLRRIAFWGNVATPVFYVTVFPVFISFYLMIASICISVMVSIWVLIILFRGPNRKLGLAVRPGLTLAIAILLAIMFIPAVLGHVKAARTYYRKTHPGEVMPWEKTVH
jgi:hypothetical protein